MNRLSAYFADYNSAETDLAAIEMAIPLARCSDQQYLWRMHENACDTLRAGDIPQHMITDMKKRVVRLFGN